MHVAAARVALGAAVVAFVAVGMYVVVVAAAAAAVVAAAVVAAAVVAAAAAAVVHISVDASAAVRTDGTAEAFEGSLAAVAAAAAAAAAVAAADGGASAWPGVAW